MLNDLSARSIYVQTREAIEAMSDVSNLLLGRSDDRRLAGNEKRPGVGLFAHAGVTFGTRATDEAETGAKVSRPYIVAGAEYGFGETMNAGLSLSYAEGKNTLRDGYGMTKGKITTVDAFASGSLGQFAVDGTVGYGWTRYDIVRALPNFARTATAAPRGGAFSAALKLSFPYAVGDAAEFRPYVQFEHQDAHVDSYAESGAGALGLAVPNQKVVNGVAEFGATLAKAMPQSWGTLIARAGVGWRHMLNDGAGTITTTLIGSPVAFGTQRLSVQDSARLGAEIGARFAHGLEATLGYRGLVGASRSSLHAIEARVTIPL